jgi:hypothetical protein
MTVNELLARLDTFRIEYGDVQVYVQTEHEVYPASDVYVDSEGVLVIGSEA